MKNVSTIILLVFIIKTFTIVAANRVSCEVNVLINIYDDSELQDPSTCLMNDGTRIDSEGFTINPTNNQIKKLLFSYNKKIFYLPMRLGGQFLNLENIEANYCSIATISKENFANLRKLRVLGLSGNQIEIIFCDTFKDLTELRILNLSFNKIKKLNGNAFRRVNKLTSIWLSGNVCINKNYENSASIARLAQEVGSKCSFSEPFNPNEPERTSNENSSEELQCGKVLILQGLIKNGTESKPGEWPFMVALYHLRLKRFFCGGSLISSRHVLSAAHCIRYKDQIEELPAQETAILLGRHDVEAAVEFGAVQKPVRKIHIHPEWFIHTTNWDADIAILVMLEAVTFSEHIQPVCLPNDLTINAYNQGSVVGWGQSESNQTVSNILRQAVIESVTDTECYTKYHNLGEYGSPTGRTFCAGGQRSGPCHGDSGGGFFVKIGSSWTLKGIVSASTLDKKTGQCDVGKYALFTRVVKFNDWIEAIIGLE